MYIYPMIGKSPWRGAHPIGYVEKENLIYAYSEASGWTPDMEDRILFSCPVSGTK